MAVAKENIRCRPSLSRLALTEAALSTALACGGSGAARVGFGRACAAAGGISFDGGAGVDISSVCTSTISIFACCATLSDAGGAISPDCCDAGGGSAGFSDARGAGAAGASDTGAADTGVTGVGAADAGAADAIGDPAVIDAQGDHQHHDRRAASHQLLPGIRI